jgi:acetyl esterase
MAVEQEASGPALTWIQKIVGPPPPGAVPPPPITSIDMIPERRAALRLEALTRDLPDVAALHEDVFLRERDGVRLTAEVYVPEGKGPFPTLLYLHGGAFCIWSPREVRRIAMRIAASGFVVVNLDYGLAPEHPFPWAVEDTVYAARWAAANASSYGGTDGEISIGGDSAGATLAAAAIAFLDGNCPGDLDEGDLAGTSVRFASAFLHCGVYDRRASIYASRQTTPGTTEIMSFGAYLGSHWFPKLAEPLVSPAYAPNLAAFPPAYLCCGSDDSTLPQTMLMTGALASAGVPVTTSVVAGFDHEFLLINEREQPAITAEWARILSWLRQNSGSAAG